MPQIHRRALVAINMLTASERRALESVIAPLVGRSEAQWPARGAVRLESPQSLYVVRVDGSLRAIVQPAVDGQRDVVDLAQAGVNLEFVFTQRRPERPGTGVLFVAPISGPDAVRAAKGAGMTETHDPVVLRVEGDNETGLASNVTQQWALAGISFQGL